MRVGDFDDEYLPLRVAPDFQLSAIRLGTELNHYTTAIEVQPLSESLGRGGACTLAKLQTDMSGTDVVEEPAARRSVRWSLKAPRV